ncbi:MAG: hypothetical protein AAGG68_04855 [Bacteroidota bacterium]
MQKIIVLILGTFFTTQAMFAQQIKAINKEVAEWTQAYQLDQSQQKIVKYLVEMKYFNFEELESMKSNDAELYERKRVNVERQTTMGIKSVLNEDQLLIYAQKLEQKRNILRQKIDEMKTRGAEKDAISKAILELKTLQ